MIEHSGETVLKEQGQHDPIDVDVKSKMTKSKSVE